METKLIFSITSKECEWDYFRGSGNGGQKKNKTSSAVRCSHKPSGAVGQAQDARSQHENKILAFRRMAKSDKFQKWVRIEARKKMGIEAMIEDKVNKSMKESNLKIEVKKEGKWQVVDRIEEND